MSVSKVNRNRTRLHRNEDVWNQAITDAKQKLKMAKERVERLQEIVADLERMKNAGELWPGIYAGNRMKESSHRTIARPMCASAR